MDQDNYCESLGRLQEIFFQYKNETLDDLQNGNQEVLYGKLWLSDGRAYAHCGKAGFSVYRRRTFFRHL